MTTQTIITLLTYAINEIDKKRAEEGLPTSMSRVYLDDVRESSPHYQYR